MSAWTPRQFARVRSTWCLKLWDLGLKMSVRPPWVIYARTFNHKIWKAAHFWAPAVLCFMKFHKQISLISNGEPIKGGWPTDLISTEIITSRCGLTMPRLFSVISLQHYFMHLRFDNYVSRILNLCGCFENRQNHLAHDNSTFNSRITRDFASDVL